MHGDKECKYPGLQWVSRFGLAVRPALGWQAEGPRFDTASALLSLQKASCVLAFRGVFSIKSSRVRNGLAYTTEPEVGGTRELVAGKGIAVFS